MSDNFISTHTQSCNYENALRGSVVLSNTGAELIQRHCYREALSVFKHSLLASRNGLLVEKSSRNGVQVEKSSSTTGAAHATSLSKENHSTIHDIMEWISLSEKKLCYSLPEVSRRQLNVHKFSVDDDPLRIQRETDMSSSSCDILLLSINEIPRYDVLDLCGFVSATILLNMGSAYMCLSAQEGCSDSEASLLMNSAYKLNCSSEAILWNLLQKHESDSFCEIVMSLSIVTSNMVQITLRCGMQKENQEASDKLKKMILMSYRLRELGFYKSDRLASARAA